MPKLLMADPVSVNGEDQLLGANLRRRASLLTTMPSTSTGSMTVGSWDGHAAAGAPFAVRPYRLK